MGRQCSSRAAALLACLLVSGAWTTAMHGAALAAPGTHRAEHHIAFLFHPAGSLMAVSAAEGDYVSFKLPRSERSLLADAFYAHNFGASIPTHCYRSSYFQPFRVYSLSVDNTTFQGESHLTFEVNSAGECAVPQAMCCKEKLDTLVIRTGAWCVQGLKACSCVVPQVANTGGPACCCQPLTCMQLARPRPNTGREQHHTHCTLDVMVLLHRALCAVHGANDRHAMYCCTHQVRGF